ncbi:hypothetical protein [Paenibacillus alvei]|uniref:hypothetical protein n=1 Tax=Paenibacillus alvei TaxID=44250 RepID=UPI0013DB440A|nr:hypothetical protein [Paenibacillus alvei]
MMFPPDSVTLPPARAINNVGGGHSPPHGWLTVNRKLRTMSIYRHAFAELSAITYTGASYIVASLFLHHIQNYRKIKKAGILAYLIHRGSKAAVLSLFDFP